MARSMLSSQFRNWSMPTFTASLPPYRMWSSPMLKAQYCTKPIRPGKFTSQSWLSRNFCRSLLPSGLYLT